MPRTEKQEMALYVYYLDIQRFNTWEKNPHIELKMVASGISDCRERGHETTRYIMSSVEVVDPLNYEHA